MKICIIGHTERNYLPYMEKYIRFFEENDVSYDIICWEREEGKRPMDSHEHNYFEKVKEGALNKLLSYARFRRHVLSILEKEHYDKIIVLTTVPAIVLSRWLRKNYSGRYLFDFRDYSFEKFSYYRKMVDNLIASSEITTISSKGFLDFLSKNDKILLNHNISSAQPFEEAPDLKNKQVINIGFIGGVRYYEENTFLIEKLKNTFRYQLWYIGKPTPNCDLPSYCKQNSVTNVSFVGKYDNSQKPELYKNIDMINSIYGDDSLEVTTALPNRLYEACLFKKPIISSKGTYLGEIIQEYDLGLVVNVEDDDVLTMINEYVEGFNSEKFLDGCHRFLKMVSNDEEILYKALQKFIEKQ